MPEFPTLADVVDSVTDTQSPLRYRSGTGLAHLGRNVAAAWLEACTITTVEQLDSLPTLAVVREFYTSAAGWQHTALWERRGYLWYCIAAPVMPPGHDAPHLPALLIWHPNWAVANA